MNSVTEDPRLAQSSLLSQQQPRSPSPAATQVQRAVEAVLWEAAERLARPSGLIQRQGQVSGPNLGQTLVLGWLANAEATLSELTQMGADVGLTISAPGLHERFTQRAATFLQALFEVAIGQVVLADPVALPLLGRFGAVCLEDSSCIRLPAELASLYRSRGGKGSPAGCKLFVRLDMLRGGIQCAPLQHGRTADPASPLEDLPLPAGTLEIRDRGFIDVPHWKAQAEQGHQVLSYLRADQLVADHEGRPLDLLYALRHAPACGEWAVQIGQEHFPMRLFFERVSPEVAARRRRRLRRDAQKRGKVLSERVNELAGWSLAVTTLAANLLSWTEALVLLRLRWQIELLFRLWKEHGRIDEWRTANPWRIVCELFAKLIGMLLQHWLLVVSCWDQPHRSLCKAAKAVRARVCLLVLALHGELAWSVALEHVQRAARAGNQVSHRLDAPSSSQMLEARHNTWSKRPLRPQRLR
jgi:Transposase DDE domain